MDKDARVNDVPLETSQAAWAIAKIIQLVGPVKRDENPNYTVEFDLAEALVDMGTIKMGSLEQELSKADAPPDCVEFIRYLWIWITRTDQQRNRRCSIHGSSP